MCVMRLRIRREKSGLLRDRMALERSALACPLIPNASNLAFRTSLDSPGRNKYRAPLTVWLPTKKRLIFSALDGALSSQFSVSN